MKLQESISREHLSGLVGARLEVLVEEPSPEWPGLHVGRVWFQAPEVDGVTYVSGPKVRPGRIVLADIEQAQSYDLVALA
jgi:tRNA-2-methylthio-N6-dimethylallyladenosine synthase/ribosomal protein S12 methylthiotransferase